MPSEAHVESATMDWLATLGYTVAHDRDVGPDADDNSRRLRDSYGEVILARTLDAALADLNPALPPEALARARDEVIKPSLPDAIRENRRVHQAIVDGVRVELKLPNGTITWQTVRFADLDHPDANRWHAIQQFTVVEHGANRRPDVVLFLNGLPVAVIELKNPGDERATLDAAFSQLQTYKAQIPSLFRTNAVLVISDWLRAAMGSLTANRERFMPWRTVDGTTHVAPGPPELEVLLHGVFDRARFLTLLRDFIVYQDFGTGLAKVVAGYHQFHGVRKAVDATATACAPDGDRRVGVIWHTQGSGKSLLMAFYAGIIVKHPALQNPTLLVITDRNDLDDQLFSTFASCRELLRQPPEQASSRTHLRQLLNRPAGGVIFTTLQKFTTADDEAEMPVLSTRRNVIVIADEAHRSQYGLRVRFGSDGTRSVGFAGSMRDALPGASFIGFTGTPIEQRDANTPAVFGDYIDIYDIGRAVADFATVPIHYESRLARLELDEDETPTIDEEVAEWFEDEPDSEREAAGKKWASVAAVVGAPSRLQRIAADLVEHFEARTAGLDGKAMIVAMSRDICVNLYAEIVKVRPDWHDEADDRGAIKVVMTGASSDPEAYQFHLGGNPKARRDLIAKRLKDPADPLKIVIVRDMWLTGFDAPCVHTMYLDKPMRGHGLMQAIARVNRVFQDKPSGLVVDYIGLAQSLKAALSQYAGRGEEHVGVDSAQAAAVLQEKYEIVRAMFRPTTPGGFDYRPAVVPGADPGTVLRIFGNAIEWILNMQQADAAQETDEVSKRRAHRRYPDAVAALATAFGLAAGTDVAKALRDEVGFFQHVRVALVKSAPSERGRTAADRELAIRQIVSRAVVSTEIVDILQAVGIASPDISVFSEEFLAEVQQLPTRNLALEAMRKLLNGEISSQSKRNVTRARGFLERLEASIAKYHANALSTAEALQELIALAREIRESRSRGEEAGLSDEEVAFYDALADDESARTQMGEDALRVLARELVDAVRRNAGADWWRREPIRAVMRVTIRRILREKGYPPSARLQAVHNVILQAETFARQFAA